MRKILLMLLVSCASYVAMAQTYEVSAHIRIWSDLSTMHCNSHYRLLFHFKDNTYREWSELLTMNSEGEKADFYKTFYLTRDNPITHMQVIAVRRYNNDCDKGSGDPRDERLIPVTMQVPCNDQTTERYTNIFSAFSAGSFIEFTVNPISNVEAIQVDGFFESAYDAAYWKYAIYGVYPDNSTILLSKDNRSMNKTELTGLRDLVRSPLTKRLSKIRFIERRTSLPWETPRQQEYSVTYNSNGEFDLPFTEPFHYGATIRIKHTKIQTPITPSLGTVMPSHHEVSLVTPETSDVLRWQYHLQGEDTTRWTYLPASYGTPRTLKLVGKDFFTSISKDYINYLYKNVYFRARYTCATTQITQIATVELRLSAPEITVAAENEKCFNARDGKFVVSLNRTLLANESVGIELNGTISPENYFATAPGNQVVVENVAPGTYNVRIVSVFNIGGGKTRTGYSGATGHVRLGRKVNAANDFTVFNATPTAVKCFGGADGKIDVTATGGTGNLTASLFLNSNQLSQLNFSNGGIVTFTDLSSGSYQVRLKDSNGCEPKVSGVVITKSGVVTQPAKAAEVGVIEAIEPLAFGYTDGYITVRASEGTMPYTFEWKNASGTVLTANPPVNEGTTMRNTLSNLAKGTYNVMAKDKNYDLVTTRTETNLKGCYQKTSVILNEPAKLTVAVAQKRPVSCNGDSDGEISARAKGGKPFPVGSPNYPYQYEWYKVVSGTPQSITDTDSIAGNLNSATFRVRITDKNGISTWSPDFKLTQPAVLRSDFDLTPVLCNGDKTGAATSLAKGGTAPYKYAWSTNDSTQTIQKLSDGFYAVVIRDARGCTTYEQVEITAPAGIVDTPTLTIPTCQGDANGSISLSVAGGKAPYTYVWDKDINQKSSVYNNLKTGTYGVVITDANKCFITREYTLTDPDMFIVDLGPDRVLCKDQSLAVNATIDDATAQYTWLKNNQAFSTDPSLSLSDEGVYHVKVKDYKGCMNEDEITITRTGEEISASIAVATRVPQNGKVRIANISFPKPDRALWILPEEAMVIEETEGYVDLSFPDKGEYNVGLTTFLDACEESTFATVKVVDARELTDYIPPDEPYIKQFMVTPNPNDGRFTVTVELKQAGDFDVLLYNGQSSIVRNESVRGKSYAKLDFDVRNEVSDGLYVVQLKTAQGYSIFKLMINK
ncbi:SprB repeat-containing protein [Pseudochryseolinea flava]|uniref:Secretion system C-terminal sorting domain-containing protein n=1 Tax=Pseudochryseolinea flava TaxID=2059302 RepID=A0A364XTS5_9BACT|nr:SprB repeat-containing protein [Pseudochryseolinea flava]RAV97751.1 hypothetical protein DQQ10_27030 [Pseudochryseolinea flava]